MKKIFALLALFAGIVTAAEAQVIEVYKNGELVKSYTNTAEDNYKVVIRKESKATPDPSAHEMVDLGLPSGLLWATCNVGASTPYEDGDYFAWGETEPKSDYTWETYKWCKGSHKTLTKYCQDFPYGYNEFTDSKVVLDAEDDAATANWGVEYRMPTYAEFCELNDNCTWTWDSVHNGYAVTSKTNGNSIFLPASGYCGGRSLDDQGKRGHYWSAKLNLRITDCACYLYFGSGSPSPYCSYYRFRGQSVRPVREK